MTPRRLADLVPPAPAQGQPKRRPYGRWLVGALVLVLVVGAAFQAGRLSGTREADRPPPAAGTDPGADGGPGTTGAADRDGTKSGAAPQDPDGPAVDGGAGPLEPKAGPAVTVLYATATGRRVPAAALAHPDRAGVWLAVPTRYLPAAGELAPTPDGPALALLWHGFTEPLPRPDGVAAGAVVLWLDREPDACRAEGWGVFAPAGPVPAVRPGDRVWSLAGSPAAPARSRGEGMALQAGEAGSLALEPPARGAVGLVDGDGQPVGWTADARQFEPLQPLWTAARQPGPRGVPFAEGIARWQRANPIALLRRAARLLDRAATPEAELRSLGEDLELAAARVGGDLHGQVLAAVIAVAERIVARQANPATALAEVRQWVLRYPDAPQLLTLAVRTALAAEAPDEAVQHYDQLRALDPGAAGRVLAALAEGLVRTGRGALAQGDARRAEWLARAALERAPGAAAAHALQAEALWALQRHTDATVAAARAAELDPAWRPLEERFRAASAEVQSTGPGRVELPFDPARGTVLARVQVNGQGMQMVFDTGASLTTVPGAVARAAGLADPRAPLVKINTSGGVVQAPRISIPELRIGSLVLRNVEAVILDLPGDLNRVGLLGLNAIGQLRVTIDRSRGRLLLEKL